MHRLSQYHIDFIVVCTIVLMKSSYGTSDKDIHFIGMFPVTGSWDRGKALKPAAEMAIEDINNRSDMLPGYRLQMTYSDTQCKSALGIKALADNVCNSPTKILIIGEGCSTVTQTVAQAAHLWNLTQISYGAVSPALSNNHTYPNFFRISNSEKVLNEARMELLRLFNWTRIATLHEDYQIFSMMIEDIRSRCTAKNIEIVAGVVYNEDAESAIKQLQDADARIIIGGFYPKKARRIFCAAYHRRFYGKQVWITTTAISHNKWWLEQDPDINCTAGQLAETLQGTLIVYNVFDNINETEEGLTKLSKRKFYERLIKEKGINKNVSGFARATTGYDTVWAAALALNKTITSLTITGNTKSISEFTYKDKAITEEIKNNLRKVEFTSVSGHVAFNKHGDGIRLIGIQTIHDSEIVELGFYDARKNNTLTVRSPLTAKNGTTITLKDFWNGRIPSDRIQTIEQTEKLSFSIYVTMSILSCSGIAGAGALLTFNIVNRNIKIVRMSSPNINNIILVGCVLAFVSVFIEDVEDTKHSIYCTMKITLLLLAFSLSFGALFAKTWRIYTIFTASLRMKKRSIQDSRLFVLIGGLVAVNSLLLTLWFVLDPVSVLTKPITDKKDLKGGVVVQYTVSFCWSSYHNHFLMAIIAFQGVFLLLGIFLAWETRKVTFSTLNESRYIGMCIYNVVALGVVGVLVSYSVRSDTTLAYSITSTITILCATVTQCLLFIPQILAYRKFRQGKLNDVMLSNHSNPRHVITQSTKTAASQTD